MSSERLDVREQGKDLALELEVPRIPLISRAPTKPVKAAPSSPAPNPPKPRPVAEVRSLDHLTEEREPLVALNVRVPVWVSTALERMVYETKATGKRIKKEVVVAEALIEYLGISKPEGVQ